MGVALAVIAAILLGFSNFLLKKSFKDFPPSVAFFIFSILGIVFWVPIGLLLGVNFNAYVLGIIVGFLSAILAQAFYIYVLEKGELSITATILESFAIYTIIFSIIFNHERPGLLTLILVLVTVFGTIIISLPEKMNKKELKRVNYILWAILAAASIGASDTLSKYFINTVSVGSFLFYTAFCQLTVSILYLKFDKQPINQFKSFIKNFSEYKFAFFGSLFISIATLSFFISFNYTLASIASPIVATSPVITVILALVFLKEKVSRKNWIGLALVLVAVILIGYFNP